ncbi:MAG: glutathione S-transferase N-terminal domain-containing protein [Pseudomonadota bacterium]
MKNPIDIASSLAASLVTTPRGLMSDPAERQPEFMLRLYEMENCPHCRVVREALTRLDLDALILPCPKGGERFRPEAEHIGGKQQFPLLVDQNTGRILYESVDIVHYLYETYGKRSTLPKAIIKALNSTAAGVASALRMGRGMRARPSTAPTEPLELYSFESSPFARLVRERLCELEIPYQLRNMGKAKLSDLVPPAVRRTAMPGYAAVGRNRQRLFERMGHVQVPFLADPNTDTEMFESSDIMDYLENTYALSEVD